MQLLKALWALAGAALCCFLVLVIHAQFLKEGQLAAGTCEIVTLDRDSSQPRRTIARQTARCACRKGQIAGTTRARPACVDARIIKTKQWCDMLPCLEGEGCDLLINRSGWTCTQPGGRIKTTTPVFLCTCRIQTSRLDSCERQRPQLRSSWCLAEVLPFVGDNAFGNGSGNESIGLGQGARIRRFSGS
ncbi:chemokine-like protein TAFA-5 isoform X3 [Sapajus apella]|uniref:Chemokine-like protein TAFA-5 isoform X3 n=1 Tax=Sapajus apella TaxID=9515 RepID=A0A6J3GUW2_SAPAP|nr:chemokine-like protein TAFA-5 isoform X3 [Sapajus apella]